MIYEEIAESVLAHPSQYTVMEVVFADGIMNRARQLAELQRKYDTLLSIMTDYERRYERSFIGRE